VIHEPAHYPKIEPSHYAQVHGVEPFERGNMKPWDLHVIPSGAWAAVTTCSYCRRVAAMDALRGGQPHGRR
jgi:hypothetical protein